MSQDEMLGMVSEGSDENADGQEWRVLILVRRQACTVDAVATS